MLGQTQDHVMRSGPHLPLASHGSTREQLKNFKSKQDDSDLLVGYVSGEFLFVDVDQYAHLRK